ncbi:phage tail protein [Pseudomonas mangiferae]|uniref:Phage tail protein n=1 Tax=Pseudomonas mangiferae TaxID=2593654 RepID=A0A553H0M3_9PSED|nr:phage tail protein [Pseudomonas mangiferae]TRX75287.1 phage tail protein [Pseudomonas mangiferae]
MMMALGLFVFSLPTLAYQELQRKTEYRHASSSRVGSNPARQFVGQGEDSITLPGVLMPELAGSPISLDVLRYMAGTGKAWALVEGTGRIYGTWVIENIDETRSLFFTDGAARRIEFSLSLKRVDDGRADLLGNLADADSQLLRALL